jgi:hypothetical protein
MGEERGRIRLKVNKQVAEAFVLSTGYRSGMEAIRSSETSVNAITTQRRILEDILHSQRCQNPKSYTVI